VKRRPSRRAATDNTLIAEIRAAHGASHGTYGRGQRSAKKKLIASTFGECAKPPMKPTPRRSSKRVRGGRIPLWCDSS
jgi:hypothetical protein